MLVSGLLALVAGMMNPGSGQAETDNQSVLYEVEVVVFRNRSPQTGGEQWPQHRPEADRAAHDDFFKRPVNTGIEELPRDQRSLQNIADSLQRSGAYDVLLHTRWRQPGLDRTLAQPYRVPHGVEKAGYRLEGTIRLVRERFLHLDIDLVLGTAAAAYPPGQYGTPPVTDYTLQETRRVRRGERHYFDHPHLGVIATVDAYEAPEPPESAETIQMEGSDPSIVGEPGAPGTDQGNTTTESVPVPAAPPGN
jgi:hypothetical protein